MSGVLIQGSLVHYESFGRGKPIIFLHGWLGSWRYWVPVMDEISTERRTYALDLWGFGDSDKAQEHYDVDAYVEMFAEFLDELGMLRVPVVGHTLGAAVALKLAQKYPDRVDKVMAVSLPLDASAINHKLLSAGPNDTLARLFWHRQRPYPEVEVGLSKTAQNVIALTIQSVARLNLREVVEDIDVPLLTVYGDKDVVISSVQADELENDHYAARAIILPGTYHFPMLDATGKFNRLLRDFMDVSDSEDLRQLTIKEEWRRRTH
ncbi:MAG: alpha/beta fold hydrolase [Anaerolineae bacterium]|nr:alpha/beta fold hydrolase [Anaerolineae bacterium]